MVYDRSGWLRLTMRHQRRLEIKIAPYDMPTGSMSIAAVQHYRLLRTAWCHQAVLSSLKMLKCYANEHGLSLSVADTADGLVLTPESDADKE